MDVVSLSPPTHPCNVLYVQKLARDDPTNNSVDSCRSATDFDGIKFQTESPLDIKEQVVSYSYESSNSP